MNHRKMTIRRYKVKFQYLIRVRPRGITILSVAVVDLPTNKFPQHVQYTYVPILHTGRKISKVFRRLTHIRSSSTVGRLPAAISFSPRRLESIYCRAYDQCTL